MRFCILCQKNNSSNNTDNKNQVFDWFAEISIIFKLIFQALDIVHKKIKWGFSKWVFRKYFIEILATILIITILVLYYV